jgi:hypothetical protein
MIPSKSQYALINSFHRSGSTFLHSALDKYQAQFTFIQDDEDYIDKFCILHTACIPNIIENSDIKTISILRDPYDAITSFMYNKLKHIGMQEFRDTDLIFYSNLYIEFTDAIQKMNGTENFIAVDFNEMIETPSVVCEKIINKFNMYRAKNSKILDNDLVILVKDQMIQQNQLSSETKGTVDISFMPEKKDPFRNSLSALIKKYKKEIDPAFKAYKKTLKLIS